MEKLEQRLRNVCIYSDEDTDHDTGQTVYDQWVETEKRKIEDSFTKYGIEGIKGELFENAETWREIPINIAVTGSSGAGKSSFVNAFLGLQEGDINAAKIGETETTTELQAFFNAKYPLLKLWDMPGVGTPKHPRKSYLKEVAFDKYDFFFILSKSRFSEDDLWLAKEVQKRKKRFYFIRTYIDTDIQNNSNRMKEKHDPEDVKSKIRYGIQSQLDENGINDSKVFLINNFEPEEYEFGEIHRKLMADSDDVKKEVIALFLCTSTSKVFRTKANVLKKRSLNLALAVAMEPKEENQRELFTKEQKFQAQQFGVDIKTVRENADILDLSKENIDKLHALLEKSDKSLQKLPNFQFKDLYLYIICYLLKIPQITEYSVQVYRFCVLAFEQNIDEMHRVALDVYGQQAQTRVVKQAVYDQ